jgi:hypothetical protein
MFAKDCGIPLGQNYKLGIVKLFSKITVRVNGSNLLRMLIIKLDYILDRASY